MKKNIISNNLKNHMFVKCSRLTVKEFYINMRIDYHEEIYPIKYIYIVYNHYTNNEWLCWPI